MTRGRLLQGDGRTHIESNLMRESLVDRSVIARTHSEREFEVLPDVILVGIGGQSVFDRGKDVIIPVADELAGARGKVKMIVGVGGGTRVRHTISVALDLGLPTGGVAQLVGAMEEANAVLLYALLAKKRSMVMQREHFWELPLYLENGMLPIVISIPPYHFWEPPSEEGPLPTHGSDFGLFILAEVLGMKKLILVKDVDGLYDADPKTHPDAKLIKKTTLAALYPHLPKELPIDRQLFDAWRTARHVDRVQLVNGLRRGELARALAGEEVGTVIDRGETHA
ncbi:MAG TPA: uridine kinase [Polyangia bacterium]